MSTWFPLENKSIPQRRILILSIPISCCFKAAFNEDVPLTEALKESSAEIQKLSSNISKKNLESSHELKDFNCIFFLFQEM